MENVISFLVSLLGDALALSIIFSSLQGKVTGSTDFLKMSNKSQCLPVIFFVMALAFFKTTIPEVISFLEMNCPHCLVHLDNGLKAYVD